MPPVFPCEQAGSNDRHGTEEKRKRVKGEVHENDVGLLMNDDGYRYLAMHRAKLGTKNQELRTLGIHRLDHSESWREAGNR